MDEDCKISESEVCKNKCKWYDKSCGKTRIIEFIFSHEDKNKINDAVKVLLRFNIKVVDYLL